MNALRVPLAATVALGSAVALGSCMAPSPTTTPRVASVSATSTSGTSAPEVARHAAAIALGAQLRTAVENAAHLAQGEHLVVRDAFSNVDGSTGIRYDRIYQGLPVLGEQVIVSHLAEGSLSIIGEPQVTLDRVESVQPTITQSGAIERVASKEAAFPVTSRRAHLVVDAVSAPAALAWAVTSSTGQGARAQDVTLTVVDATSGSVRREERLSVEVAS